MSHVLKTLSGYKFFLPIVLIILGVVYRLITTSDGNFIFNMDNARDFIDIREMVYLHKLRLISNTSGIAGFYTGPAWYYLLSIPFVITSGSPYGAIILMIILWTIGGYSLYLLCKNLGVISIIAVLSLWISSNFIALSTLYSYNPNPVILLMPLFVYLFSQFLKNQKFIFAAGVGLLAGSFFNFEVVFGIFMPVIILLTILIFNKKLFKNINTYVIFFSFTLALLPQLIFDLRHQFIMTHSLISYLTHPQSSAKINLFLRIPQVISTFYNLLKATFENWQSLLNLILILFGLVVVELFREKKLLKDEILIICSLLIFIPLTGLILTPITVYSWHIGGSMAAAIILVPFIIYKLQNFGGVYKIVSLLTAFLITIYSIYNLELPKLFDRERILDPSIYRNEVDAIDFVYKIANGKNFKVYTYLPSVYDYPYQYLFGWYGLKTYKYTPSEFAYLPNKFPYISNKDKFPVGSNPPSSGLVFLIKEPDPDPSRRKLWENYFRTYPKVQVNELGRIEVETKKDIINQ